jgi:hypothetical protein
MVMSSFLSEKKKWKFESNEKTSTWFFRFDVTVDEYINRKEKLKSYHPIKRKEDDSIQNIFFVHKVQLWPIRHL